MQHDQHDLDIADLDIFHVRSAFGRQPAHGFRGIRVQRRPAFDEIDKGIDEHLQVLEGPRRRLPDVGQVVFHAAGHGADQPDAEGVGLAAQRNGHAVDLGDQFVCRLAAVAGRVQADVQVAQQLRCLVEELPAKFFNHLFRATGVDATRFVRHGLSKENIFS